MNMNLVKYAGEFWVTLADFTSILSTKGYSNQASVKSAVRTFVVRTNPQKYIAFRGEQQIKNIIQENKDNPLFHEEDFVGHTRAALIQYDLIGLLDSRFAVKKEHKAAYNTFLGQANAYIEEVEQSAAAQIVTEEGDVLQERSTMLRYLRNELTNIDKEMETLQSNREKILQALNALESLELPVM